MDGNQGSGAAAATTDTAGPPTELELADHEQLRRGFAAFASGVTVVTVGGDRPHGMTANAFTSVSLDPPLVLVCVDRRARMHQALARTGTFAVSVLAAGQERVAAHFASSRRPDGAAQFAGWEWSAGRHTAAPLLAGAMAWFECRLWQAYAGGDHSIFVGALLSATRVARREPLVFFDGGFQQLAGERAT